MAIGYVSTPWLVTLNRLVTTARPKEGETLIVAASNSNNTDRADYVCTGTNDDIIINQALNALPAAGGSVILLEGTYNITNSIIIPKDNITLLGNGYGSLIQTSSDITMISSTGRNSIIIEKMRMVGVTGQTANVGILFNSTTLSSITDCYINTTGSVGIFFNSTTLSSITKCHITATDSYAIRNITSGINIFHENCIRTCKNDCIRIESGDDNIISNNYIDSADSTYLIYAASNDNVINGNKLNSGQYGIYSDGNYNNVFGNNISNVIVGGAGPYTYGVYLNKDRCVVNGNDIISCDYGVYCTATSNYNQISGNFCICAYGVYVLGDDNGVASNNCSLNSNYGIYIGSDRNTVTGNTCNGNFKTGIYIDQNIFYNTVTGNSCSDNLEYGIYLTSTGMNTLTGNTSAGNIIDGIYLTGSNHNTISGNNCSDNTNDGIHLAATSDQNIIIGNRCYSNGRDGIRINAATCDDNMIAKNHLIGNTAAALTDSGTTTDLNGNLVASGVVVGASHPITENYTASSCTGTNGSINRTLTLANVSTSSHEQVTLDGLVLRATTDYTIVNNAASSVITFIRNVYDEQNITVRYYT